MTPRYYEGEHGHSTTVVALYLLSRSTLPQAGPFICKIRTFRQLKVAHIKKDQNIYKQSFGEKGGGVLGFRLSYEEDVQI